MDHDVLALPDGRRIGYRLTSGEGPTVVFMGGFRSDMTGIKAAHLETWAQGSARAFLRFDYTGHGVSSGRFEDGTIGQWASDAEAVVRRLTEGPRILVGSSMGGWIALLVARRVDEVAGLVGIAAAPDFTEDLMWARFADAERRDLQAQGFVTRPSDYAAEPEIITRNLIEEGRSHLVLRAPLRLPFPVRLLHGTDDRDVPPTVALRLLDHAAAPDMRLTLVKGADHRFSSPDCLALIVAAVEEVSGGRSTS